MQNKNKKANYLNKFLSEVLNVERELNDSYLKYEGDIYVSLSSDSLEELETFMKDLEKYNYENEVCSTEGHAFIGVLNRTKILATNGRFYVLFNSRNNIGKVIECAGELKHLEEYIKQLNLNLKLGLLLVTPNEIKCYGDIDNYLSPYLASFKLDGNIIYKFYDEKFNISYDAIKFSIKFDENSEILEEHKVFNLKAESSHIKYDELKELSFSIQ